MTQTLRVGIVGLGFGAEFIPIYQAHPDAELVAVCQRNPEALDTTAKPFEVPRRYTDFADLLDDPDIDAVHINTPIQDHADHTIAALQAGKHVACTVPMATTLDDCQKIVAAAKAADRRYMMMETSVYSREFLHVKQLVEDGTIGRIQFVRGAHHQEMAGWPGYWAGLPPMHYATHVVGPVLAITGAAAASVVCQGSGRIADELASKHGSPFAVESGLLTLVDSDVSAEVCRSLFETAREYVESFSVFGSEATFEWEQTEGAGHVLHLGENATRVQSPDFAHLLPPEIATFTQSGVYGEDHQHLSFIQGGGHGGSHPHLVHEFVSSINEGREASINAAVAANWTAVGICAHESALRQGARVTIPDFTATLT